MEYLDIFNDKIRSAAYDAMRQTRFILKTILFFSVGYLLPFQA